jgi:threonine dehydratase
MHVHGQTLADAVEAARAIAAREGLPYFEDGGSAAQLEGVAPLGRSLADHDPSLILTPIACGALAAGIALGVKDAGSDAAVVGVQVRACSRFAARWHDRPEPPSRPEETIADGLADDRIVDPAFSTCRELLADVVVVEEATIHWAVRELAARAGVLAEGAGAAALAGLATHASGLPRGKVVIVVSGQNIAPELAERILATPS